MHQAKNRTIVRWKGSLGIQKCLMKGFRKARLQTLIRIAESIHHIYIYIHTSFEPRMRMSRNILTLVRQESIRCNKNDKIPWNKCPKFVVWRVLSNQMKLFAQTKIGINFCIIFIQQICLSNEIRNRYFTKNLIQHHFVPSKWVATHWETHQHIQSYPPTWSELYR